MVKAFLLVLALKTAVLSSYDVQEYFDGKRFLLFTVTYSETLSVAHYADFEIVLSTPSGYLTSHYVIISPVGTNGTTTTYRPIQTAYSLISSTLVSSGEYYQ